ncbi:hypothetical protein BKA61DRAFT_605278 [Leptodontidium sp. MPI-SDFR-AT-0119]|nr:hypothetical protein BKA61DRAFT_605278 [Leptodontidium sp. MPI-SDFR-AT-0119]
MSNATDAADAQGPFPSFEELKSARVIVSKSPAGFRLFWSLDGPFPEAISVMQDRHTPTSLTPYYSNGTWHPISQEPISVPKISSVTVGVNQLDHWEDDWEDCHEAHGERGDGQEGRWYGALEDHEYDPQDDSDRANRLLGCCGEPRPRNKKVRIVVRPASGTFVTVHDYLSTLHPWLMGMKEDIRRSTNVWQGGLTDMMVDSGLHCLWVEEKSYWIRHTPIIINSTARQPELLSNSGPGFGPDNMSDFTRLR